MADGILVCGLNGSGKTTLGKALAAKLGFHFIDSEALFFPAGPDYSARISARRRRSACSRRSAPTAISSSPTCGAITARRPPHFTAAPCGSMSRGKFGCSAFGRALSKNSGGACCRAATCTRVKKPFWTWRPLGRSATSTCGCKPCAALSCAQTAPCPSGRTRHTLHRRCGICPPCAERPQDARA